MLGTITVEIKGSLQFKVSITFVFAIHRCSFIIFFNNRDIVSFRRTLFLIIDLFLRGEFMQVGGVRA